MSANNLKVALDWTPNTIHTGLFIALEHGLYKAHGLNVELLPPDETYTRTPAKQLEHGDVHLAICPSESCIAYRESGCMQLQAIYAILQKDASAIVSTRPDFADLKALEKATYGSYNARYEDHIVRAMVDTAGGDGAGMKIKSSAGKLSLFEEMKQGAVDATWVFMPWEGVEAELDGTKLHVFKTEDYGVPYGYSPVIARNAGSESLSPEVLSKFVQATKQGYEYAMKNPKEAAAVMAPHCRPQRSSEFLEKSQEQINQSYSDGSTLGLMKAEKWERWVQWLKSRELLKVQDLDAADLFTNEFVS